MNAARSDRLALLRALAEAERNKDEAHRAAAAADRVVATIRDALKEFPAAAPDLPFLSQDEVGLKQVAFEVGRSPDTIRRWTIKYRLGRKFGGQWLVSRNRLLDFMCSSEAA